MSDMPSMLEAELRLVAFRLDKDTPGARHYADYVRQAADRLASLRSLLSLPIDADLEGAVRGLLAKADGYCAEVDQSHEELIALRVELRKADRLGDRLEKLSADLCAERSARDKAIGQGLKAEADAARALKGQGGSQ
jgi:hypothetical protein